MPSVVDICNNALDKVGKNPIISLDDNVKAARVCKRMFPLVRDRELRKHNWNFAIKREDLAKLAETPVSGFSSQFQLPDENLRFIEAINLSENEMEVEGGRVLTNTDTLSIRYLARIEDMNKWDTLALDALTLKLAADICLPLTQSRSNKRMLLEEYDNSLYSEAKPVDAQENPVTTLDDEDDAWLAARR